MHNTLHYYNSRYFTIIRWCRETSLILVDCHLPIDDVCKQFGFYMGLIVKEDQESEASASACTSDAGAKNAFEMKALKCQTFGAEFATELLVGNCRRMNESQIHVH